MGGQSRRAATAVLLAMAVLAVLGSIFGYVLGTRANQMKAQGGDGARVVSEVPVSQAPPSVTPSGEQCPTFMQEAALRRGAKPPLLLVLYVATERNLSEVWICRAADEHLWYQGHKIEKGRYPVETPVEAVNGLLLDDVLPTAPGEYLAKNTDGTRYAVSRSRLEIRYGFEGTRTEQQRVVESRPKQ